MISKDEKVNFYRETSITGRLRQDSILSGPDYVVENNPYDTPTDAYTLREPDNLSQGTVTLEVTDHTPSIHEIFVEQDDANPLQLALLGNAAFQRIALDNRATIDKTNVFALIDIRGDLEEALARKILYERAFGMQLENITRDGELIMLGGTEQDISGASTWIMQGNGVHRPQHQSGS